MTHSVFFVFFFILNISQKEHANISRQVTEQHGGLRAAAGHPLRREAKRPLQVQGARADPGDKGGGRLQTQAEVLFHESL